MFAATVETTSAVFTDTLTATPPLMSAAWMVRVPEVPAAPVPVDVPPKPEVAPERVSWSLRPTVTTVAPTAPPEKPIVFGELVPMIVLSMVYDPLCQEASCRAWVMVACIDWMLVVIDVRPLSAALRMLTPLVIESSRLVNSPAREERDAAVKKFVGLSRAELTFLPVARRCCVVAWLAVVFCSASRFARTADVRVIAEDMVATFLVVCRTGSWLRRSRRHSGQTSRHPLIAWAQ